MSTKATPEAKESTFRVSLLLFRGMCDVYFTRHFDFFRRNDALFRDNSYGHISREVQTHIYLMHRNLSALEDGKWKTRDEFKPYFSALNFVPLLGDDMNATGKEYHEQATDLSIKRVRYISNIHVFDRWRTNKLVPLAIGGHPVISKHLLRWIFSST
jgi:hypothetical protein